MKKTLLILSISGFGLFASAQSFDVGLKGGIASTWLMNTNVNNAGTDEDIVSTISGDFGLHLQYNFNDKIGVELEFISEAFNQKYKGTFANPPGYINNDGAPIYYIAGESYTATTKLNELKIPLLFHYQATSGFTFEVGPELASISSATYTANYTGNPVGTPSTLSYSTKSDFASSNMAAVIGFGWNFQLSGQFYLLTDLRFEYGLTDLVGTDGHGQDLKSGSSLYSSSTIQYSYPSYTATHSIEGSLNIGVFYRIPTGGGSGASKSSDKK
jgi:hypothetical protein